MHTHILYKCFDATHQLRQRMPSAHSTTHHLEVEVRWKLLPGTRPALHQCPSFTTAPFDHQDLHSTRPVISMVGGVEGAKEQGV